MGLWDKLTGEFIDIVEWTDNSNATLVWRFERYQNEIKNGAQLTVRQGQVATFVNEGQIADVFESGMYELTTENLPILSTLKGWEYGFSSPFKAEVYFVNLRTFTDAIGESKIPILDMASNYDELSDLMCQKMNPDFGQYGLTLPKFLVENISLPPNVEEALDKHSSMGILGNLNQYSQYQSANAMEQAAQNPGGNAGAGIGMGMGFTMANQMAQTMNTNQHQPSSQQPASPPPLPQQKQYFIAVNGQQVGLLPVEQIGQKVQANEVNRDSLIWAEGMANWTKAGDVDDLKSIFGSMPPPLPGV